MMNMPNVHNRLLNRIYFINKIYVNVSLILNHRMVKACLKNNDYRRTDYNQLIILDASEVILVVTVNRVVVIETLVTPRH